MWLYVRNGDISWWYHRQVEYRRSHGFNVKKSVLAVVTCPLKIYPTRHFPRGVSRFTLIFQTNEGGIIYTAPLDLLFKIVWNKFDKYDLSSAFFLDQNHTETL